MTVHHGDALDVLATLPDCSADAVVTDPPYAIGFMQAAWDTHTPGGFQHWCELWAAECLRILKPGGHMLAFGGTRTYHRLAAGIEDAGFEIRDSLHWITGQGFPKSLNVNKDGRFCQCAKAELAHGPSGVRRVREDVPDVRGLAETGEVSDLLPPVQREGAGQGVGNPRPQGSVGAEDLYADARRSEPGLEGWSDTQAAEGKLHRPGVRPVPSGVLVDGEVGRLRDGAPASHGALDRPPSAEVGSGEPQGPQPTEQRPGKSRAVPVERGPQAGRGWPVCGGCGKPSLPPGLGTALRPAHEPIVVARKPLAGTVAANVQQYGTGAINIDGCRVATDDVMTSGGPMAPMPGDGRAGASLGMFQPGTPKTYTQNPSGRWPANVLFDDEAAQMLDEQSGVLKAGGTSIRGTTGDVYGGGKGYLPKEIQTSGLQKEDGGASRFFPVFRYQAKAGTRERPDVNGVKHPTVKPLELMRWLVRLVTPPGGTVLDPFAGSGTTAEACEAEGFSCVAIEREAAYLPLIEARLARARAAVAAGNPQLALEVAG